MLELAFDGITSLSVKPIRMITVLGFFIAVISFIGVIWGDCYCFYGESSSRMGINYLYNLFLEWYSVAGFGSNWRIYR